MSLEDELTQATLNGLTGEEWLEQWVGSLSSKDKKTWEAWLNDPRKPTTVLYRVARAHGYPRKLTVFRDYVREYRDSLR